MEKYFDLIFSIECAVFRCIWLACEIYKDELQSCVLSPWLLSSLIWLGDHGVYVNWGWQQ